MLLGRKQVGKAFLSGRGKSGEVQRENRFDPLYGIHLCSSGNTGRVFSSASVAGGYRSITRMVDAAAVELIG